MVQLSRERYAQLYGPTTGDRVRLADTDLLVEVEEDRCGGPGRAGEEAVFGGGKVIRESMGQGRATRAEVRSSLVPRCDAPAAVVRPGTTRAPPSGTSVTVRVMPGSKRTAVPAATSSR